MRPKKAKEIIPIVSKETGYSQAEVTAVVKEYWKSVSENLSGLTSPKIHIVNLGDFNIKHWSLDKQLEKKKLFLTKKSKMNYPTILNVENSIRLMEGLKFQMLEEKQRKEFIYEHKRNKTDMEEQKGYFPGDMV